MSNKRVPPLRFPEFKNSPSWKVILLGELSKPVEDRAKEKKYILMSVTSGVGLVPQTEKFGREIAGNSYKNYYVIKKYDFAYNKSATKLYPEGYIAMLKDYDEVALPNSIFTCFRITDSNSVPRFYDYLFSSNYHGKWLKQYITVGARANGALSVDNKHLWNMPIGIPTEKKEQQKIADCLTSFDELLSAENTKLELLKQHKKALMQKLFPQEGKTVPEWRFPEFSDSGEWEKKPLFILADKIIKRNKDGKVKRVFTNSATEGVVDQRNYFDREIVDYENLKNYLVIDDGDYVYNPRVSVSAPVGPISKNKIGKGVMSPLYTIFRFKNQNNNFYEHYFKTSLWHTYLTNISNTGARHDRMNISSDGFINMPLLSTVQEEKEKIAACLSSIDEHITAQAEKVELLKEHKKALLQGLFVGGEGVE